MAYEVTATRRRPQKLENLVGQEFVAATLKNSIENGRIAHAYLFTGPRGCGKTSTARILSKALNCVKGPSANPCGECANCLEIAKGTNTDVIEIDGASNNGIDYVRQIKQEILFPPQSSRYKIYIIDEVHMLSVDAFNALLKTIEEPPPHVIFIFATTELQKVPATIKSRCQQFNFRLVPIEKVKNLLAEAAAEIGIKADDEALYWVARESTGSIRDAYTLFDQVAAFSGDHITYDKIRDKLGLVGVDRLNDIFEKCASNDATQVLDTLDSYLQSGISIEQLISNSTDYLRSLLLIKNGITKESLLGQSAERFSQKVLSAWSAVQLERAISIFFNLYRDIRYSLSPRYELELAFSRLSWLSSYVSPFEVKASLDKAKQILMNQSQGNVSPNVSPNISANGGVPQQNNYQPNSQSGAVSNPDLHPNFQFSRIAKENASQNESPSQNQVSSQSQNQNFSQPQNPAAPQVPNPFSNGGAVPPKQTAVQASAQFAQNGVQKIPELRERVLSDFAVTDALLASSLMQTENWVLNGNVVTSSVLSSFQKMQLNAHLGKISAKLAEIIGRPVQFVVEEAKTEPKPTAEQMKASFPSVVQLLCNTFRGEVVGHSKSSAKPESQTQISSSENENDSESSDNNSMQDGFDLSFSASDYEDDI